MHEYISLGSVPCEEDCAAVGEDDYFTRALAECRAYVRAIRRKLGKEPEGASLEVEGFSHDSGRITR